MFSSSNPFPSSIHGLPPPSGTFFGQEKCGVYFNHHPFVAGDYCSFDHAPPLPPVKASGLQNCYHINLNHQNQKKVAASKKVRQTKIFTAQGPRDRRVRLSINISKKFFGLQDLLGFDKASKTLDWLFTRSKSAIKDLVEEKKHTSSSTLSDQCEKVFMDNGYSLDKKGKKKKTTKNQKSGFHVNLTTRKQLRAEARSRARERTIEKLRTKKRVNDKKIVLEDHTNYCYLEYWNQIQSQSNHEVSIGELLTEHKLPKSYSLQYNSQHDYVDSKDSSSEIKNSTHLIYCST